MVDQVTAAALSANVYLTDAFGNPVLSDQLVNAPGWILDGNKVKLESNGFAAGAYRNGSEYVIAFRGTDGWQDFAFQNLGLVSSTLAQQTKSAIDFVEQKIAAIAAANSISLDAARSHITFTGHSLGGGLATLMGALYERPAIAFDPAPTLQTSAPFPIPIPLLVYLGVTVEITVNGFMELLAEIAKGRLPAGAPIPGRSLTEAQLIAHYTDRAEFFTTQHTTNGEVLSWAFPDSSMAGHQQYLYDLGTADHVSLHSMALLALAIKRPEFVGFAHDFEVLTKNMTDPALVGIENSKHKADSDIIIRRLINEQAFYNHFVEELSRLKSVSAFDANGHPITATLDRLLPMRLAAKPPRLSGSAGSCEKNIAAH